MKPEITFRTATFDDLELLKYWDSQPHVIAAGIDEDWGWEEDLALESSHYRNLIAILRDKPIGVVQIIDPYLEETNYWGKDVASNLRAIDIWIGEAENLNKGYGTRMMELVFEYCFSDPKVEAIIIDPLVSNSAAIRFYKRLGFEFVEYRTFDRHECMVLRYNRSRYEGLARG